MTVRLSAIVDSCIVLGIAGARSCWTDTRTRPRCWGSIWARTSRTGFSGRLMSPQFSESTSLGAVPWRLGSRADPKRPSEATGGTFSHNFQTACRHARGPAASLLSASPTRMPHVDPFAGWRRRSLCSKSSRTPRTPVALASRRRRWVVTSARHKLSRGRSPADSVAHARGFPLDAYKRNLSADCASNRVDFSVCAPSAGPSFPIHLDLPPRAPRHRRQFPHSDRARSVTPQVFTKYHWRNEESARNAGPGAPMILATQASARRDARRRPAASGAQVRREGSECMEPTASRDPGDLMVPLIRVARTQTGAAYLPTDRLLGGLVRSQRQLRSVRRVGAPTGASAGGMPEPVSGGLPGADSSLLRVVSGADAGGVRLPDGV